MHGSRGRNRQQLMHAIGISAAAKTPFHWQGRPSARRTSLRLWSDISEVYWHQIADLPFLDRSRHASTLVRLMDMLSLDQEHSILPRSISI